MAPEIRLMRPYQPQQADLFALGVILFSLRRGGLPFAEATFNDPHYCLIAKGSLKAFWLAHEKGKPEGFYSAEFKDLISNMLALQPFQRLALADIVMHPFF